MVEARKRKGRQAGKRKKKRKERRRKNNPGLHSCFIRWRI